MMRRVGPARAARLLRVLAAAMAVAAAALLAAPAAFGETETTTLGSYGLRAAASGGRISLSPEVGGTVPDAAASLDTGGIAYGRSSIAWPGPVFANMGDLIILASGGQFPPDMADAIRTLNYPVRAEARSPGGPPEASYDGAPGVTMTATSSDRHAEAITALQRIDIPDLGTLASATTVARTALEDGVGRSTSESTVSGIDIADGLIQIEAVHSRAEASSDGNIGEAGARTTVTGVTVAGTPARLDESGLHIGGDGEAVPINEAANEAAARMFGESGMVVLVTEPTIEQDGPEARAIAGSVLIALSEDGPFIVLGGASASSSAGEAFSFSLPDLAVGSVGPPPPATSTGGGIDLAPPPPPSSPAPPEPVAAPGPQILRAASTEFPAPEFAGILAVGSLLALLSSRFMRRLAACLDATAAGCPVQGAP